MPLFVEKPEIRINRIVGIDTEDKQIVPDNREIKIVGVVPSDMSNAGREGEKILPVPADRIR